MIDDLACRRGGRLIFARLSLTLAPGEVCHVIGPNGVGKSSLLRLVAGLMRPYAGRVRCAGAVGLVDERCALDLDKPLAAALAFWARLDGVSAQAADAATEALGLDGLLDVPVRYLSSGQRQRAAMARLVGQHAAVWLLDEPLNALDSAGAALVAAMVERHCAGGGIALVASHQPFAMAGMRRLALADYAT